MDTTPRNFEVLSENPASPGQVRLITRLALLSLLLFLACWPLAKTPLPKIWPFIPIYETALILNDLFTVLLLTGQFLAVRSPALAVLLYGYLFTATMAAVHLLSFPGLFSASGLLGAGPQTTAWLYMFWHAGFPLAVLAYAYCKEHAPAPLSPRFMAIGTLSVLALVAGLSLLATWGQAALPAVMQGNHYTPSMQFVVGTVWAMSLLALLALIARWRKAKATTLDAWLGLVMCAWVFDIALSAMLNAGRFDLGFYAGRIYGLLAATFILAVLMLENGRLLRQLLLSRHGEMQKSAELVAANKELESFSYSVSHDLRAPLRAIDGFAGMLMRRAGARLDNEDLRLLNVVRDNSKIMGQLIDDLLAFSRLGRQELTRSEIDVTLLVQEVWKGVSEPFAGELVLNDLPRARGDRALLKQVWINLLSNAVKYSSGATAPRIEVGGRDEGGHCRYWVRDNGAGFDMRYVGKLFGVFQRLHSAEEFPGTGVGLAIVARVVLRHDGKVWAEGALGQGATFHFSLPNQTPTEMAAQGRLYGHLANC
ncbi:MASE4 domain-containing protein [Chitinimonas sp.]|uniref:MASE4 domain-containing protein n=1 Tax=Chitinimonas sp. TaxID=1934313 RepID=UPI002F94489B